MFFNDTATTEIYTLSLHDALPILRSALGELIIEGIDTNLDFQFEILSNPVYQDGHKIDTGFIPDQFPEYCK